MRIIHLIDSLGPGGAERSLVELIPHLTRSGFDPLVVACVRVRDHGAHEVVERLGTPVHVLPGPSFFARVTQFRNLLRHAKPALVHTTLFESDLVGRVAASGTRIPVLTSLVNTTYDPVRYRDPRIKPFRLRAAQWLDGYTARSLTTWFHAITSAVRDHAMATLRIDGDRTTVIERGRDSHRLGEPGQARRRDAREMLGLAPHDEVVLNVGRQEFQKGQLTLLQAADEILLAHPRAVLLIAGRIGSATQELQRVHNAMPNGSRVRFLGHRDNVPDLMAAADVFVFPSLYEGLGGALIEAMALGLPIVASQIPAIAEVVREGQNALLVPPERPEQLAAAVRTLLASGSRRQAFAEYGRRRFLERFTLERSASRMAGLFHHVASLRGVPRVA